MLVFKEGQRLEFYHSPNNYTGVIQEISHDLNFTTLSEDSGVMLVDLDFQFEKLLERNKIEKSKIKNWVLISIDNTGKYLLLPIETFYKLHEFDLFRIIQ